MNEAFVYKWTNTSNGMIYVGYHKGNPDDGYVCSSKYFLEEYKNLPEIFTREILAFGSTKEMVDLETNILKENNAGKNPMFYNRHCNNGQYVIKHTDETKAKISASHMGKKVSEEFREKRRQHMLQNNPFKGKVHSEKTKLKISKFKKTQYIGAGNPKAISVRYNGIIYPTIKIMSEETSISKYIISKMIKQGIVEKLNG